MSVLAALESVRARPPRWVAEEALPPLRDPSGEPLSEPARRGLLATLKKPDEDPAALRAAIGLIAEPDRAALLRVLRAQWIAAGSPPADRRWLIAAEGLLGDEAQVDDLGRRVGEEVAAKRHQAARHCLDALHRNGGPAARRWLSRWARQAPTLSLRAEAWAAKMLLEGADPDAPLSARPPDLGFDALRGEQDYDHAGRRLRLRLEPGGELLLFEGDRPLSALPAARRQDDPAAVAASRERFRALRDATREALAALHAALEEAMILGQPLADWQATLHDPLAYRASRGLVFEGRSPEQRRARFFYSDEMAPLDLHGEEVSLAGVEEVRVVHPANLSAEERAGWRAILDDAGALSPFPQLERPVVARLEGPAPLARALGVIPPLGTARIARGLAARGYLPDTSEGGGWAERSLKFLGPYCVVLAHEPFSPNPYHWDRTKGRVHRLLGVEVRLGAQPVASERLRASIYSEIVAELRAL